MFKSTLSDYSNPCFAGREEELAMIRRMFEGADKLYQRIALFGLGGIG